MTDALLKKLKQVRTMAELDAMRLECVRGMDATGDMEESCRIQRIVLNVHQRLTREGMQC